MPVQGPVIVAETQVIVRPPLPAPVTLTRVHWQACGDQACVPINEAKSQVSNRIKVGQWMSKMNAAVHYYEAVTVTPSAALSK